VSTTCSSNHALDSLDLPLQAWERSRKDLFAKAGPIQQAILTGILRLEQGRQTSEEAWRQAVRDAERAAAG
jgi:hypothetical protein